ncbi:MAG: efflux RND transporter periplasmic adaptor subunit [Pseudomonadota bacterium]
MSDHDTPTGGLEPGPTRRRNAMNGILQVVLVVGVLAAGLIANRVLSSGSSVPQLRTSGSAIATVETVLPEIRDTEVRVEETGTVQVRNSIELSPQVGGRVVYINPALVSGGTFSRGQVLFRLDDSDYQANIERARADLASRQADLQVEQAESDIARREWDIVNPGQPIPPNVAREPQLARAEAAVRSAEAALADARLDIDRVAFSLPFNGRILSTSIEVGQNLMAGQSYGRAYDPEGIEVSVPVNQAVLQGLAPAEGREAIIRVNGGPLSQSNTSYQAIVSGADAELDAQTRLARLTLEFTETVPLLPGEFVDVEIIGPTVPGAYRFPESAMQENRSLWVVDDGVLQRRQPQLVFADAGTIVALPFDRGDGIVVTPLNDPEEGDPVVAFGASAAQGAQP